MSSSITKAKDVLLVTGCGIGILNGEYELESKAEGRGDGLVYGHKEKKEYKIRKKKVVELKKEGSIWVIMKEEKDEDKEVIYYYNDSEEADKKSNVPKSGYKELGGYGTPMIYEEKIAKHIYKQEYGQIQRKEKTTAVDVYYLSNEKGMSIEIMTYGATIRSLTIPNKKGKVQDIVIGCDSLQDYQEKSRYFGSTIGRYCNRIKGGKLELNGKQYQLSVNETKKDNCLHGGWNGFDKQIWKVTKAEEDNEKVTLQLQYLSVDGEEGFPSNCLVTVTFQLGLSHNSFDILFSAAIHQHSLSTVVNLTNHSYFSLTNSFATNAVEHTHFFHFPLSSHFVPIDANSIPIASSSSPFLPVANTPFDFTSSFHSIHKQIALSPDHPQILAGNGFDHSFAISHKDSKFTFHSEIN
ncbi:aldose 1-epimerase [Reticulomyxa filosa]|uniref:Aldose 1-epimerase n=1 Tax=Reticulomyxa filosa TaxID=46433 RepID=X6NAL1_RETFI|nr:aldose 1-epimerase [Reticulomyxa filosa]|eukprot:ETO22804.1 aldose 1-epimerase [Reticulomyxa filosa]